MPTSATIHTALATAVKSIKVANGYLQDIPDANVFSINAPDDQSMSGDLTSYPRVFIYSDGADYADLPSNGIMKSEIFTLIANFAKADAEKNDPPTLATMVANFIDDFEKMTDRNKQLGGADMIKLRACADDVGANETEAVCMFEVVISYRRRF